jgi:hypothetical protein
MLAFGTLRRSMASSLSWIDFSAADRERMHRAMALFQDRETRDELGLGTIRDAFSDVLFPGTSTIMTRLRYFLFVPWIYRELEEERVRSEAVARRLRVLEEELIRQLNRTNDAGVVGGRAVDAVQRTPSSIYWAGVQRWGIAQFAGSQAQYHQEFDRIRARRLALDVPDDEGVERATLSTWHPQLPPPPEEWRTTATFALTVDEAEFVLGRLIALHPKSLLAWLAARPEAPALDFAWELLPLRSELPETLQQRLQLARRFSFAFHGATWLYNLQLAEQARRDELAADHRASLAAWAANPERRDLEGDWLRDVWALADEQRARVPHPTRAFVHAWVAECLSDHDFGSSPLARRLVREREVRLKGSRSRFTNRRALETWNGRSGVARLQFRWGVAQRILRDLCDGLGAKEA